MVCHENWNFEHYLPLYRDDAILIDRVAPGESEIALSFAGGHAPWTVLYRLKGSEDAYLRATSDEPHITLTGLSAQNDYEFYVASGNLKSETGYARTGKILGAVVNYLHPEDSKYSFSGQHLCTPSLLVHPDGYMLASMDIYEGGAPQNLTLIFRSDDGGKTWYHLTELFPCFWGSLFLNKGDVYMLAVSTEYGDLLIGKSTDGGKNWEKPTVLSRGSSHSRFPGWHKSSMPVIEHNGRIWCAVDYGSHATGGHMSCLVSANADRDLLDASNWLITDPLKYDPSWPGAVVGDNRGFIEGNAVVLPDGEIGNMLRYMTDRGTPSYGLAALLRGDAEHPGDTLKFSRFVKFPGNLSKFDVRRDEKTGVYFSICSRITDEHCVGMRNLLSLVCSKDLEEWYLIEDLIDWRAYDPQYTAAQYVSFAFHGEDILFLSRTAFNGAQNFHDNNYITFHKISNFRLLIPDLLKA